MKVFFLGGQCARHSCAKHVLYQVSLQTAQRSRGPRIYWQMKRKIYFALDEFALWAAGIVISAREADLLQKATLPAFAAANWVNVVPTFGLQASRDLRSSSFRMLLFRPRSTRRSGCPQPSC